MKGLNGGLVVIWGEDIIGEVRGDCWEEFGLEGLLDSAGT